MGNLYIIGRHGETPYNLKKRFSGQTDVPLTSKGYNQAVAGRGELSDILNRHDTAISTAFQSHLIRSIHTAEIMLGRKVAVFNSDGTYKMQDAPNDVFRHKCELKTEERLAERSYGDLEGLSKIAERKPKDYWDRPENGESLADVEERVASVIDETKANKGQVYFMAVHAGVMRVAHVILDNYDRDDANNMSFKNGGLVVFDQRTR